MLNNMFERYDEKSFSYFRIALYSILLLYYSFFQPIYSEAWTLPQFKSFYDPISFFSFLDYSQLEYINQISYFDIWKYCMAFSAIGLLYPLSSSLSFLGLLYLAGIGLNFGKINHVNHMPVVILGIMAFSFNPGRISVDYFLFKKIRSKLPEVTHWSLRTAQIYMVILYFASGFQKFRNSGLDWVFSDNMQTIILTRPTVTELGLWIAKFPILCKSIAFLTLLAEITAPLALLSTRYKLFVIPTLFMFHIGTLSVLGLHGYFIPYNLCFLIWLPWDGMTKGNFLLSARKMLSWVPGLNAALKFFYVHVLFKGLKYAIQTRFGNKVKLVLRHSILGNKFDPFFSDIDYSVIVKKDFSKMDDLVGFLIKVNKLKVFDLPQVYLEEEWERLNLISPENLEKIEFVWHFRKIAWIKSEGKNSLYEVQKKERALNISSTFVDKMIDELRTKGRLPGFNPNLPQVCLYSHYLEVLSKERIFIMDIVQLDWIISFLPGELPRINQSTSSDLLKRDLWIQEYLLSRSHLRVHSRTESNVDHYKPWLRYLEQSYLDIYKDTIVNAGEEFDMDHKC